MSDETHGTHHGEVDRMAANWPVLSLNSKGPDVTVLQYLLRAARTDWKTLSADGVYGPRTQATVETFQDVASITVDGVVGPQTWEKLTDNSVFDALIRSGSRGECVKAAQSGLLKQHELTGPSDVDGVFGPVTDAATRSFQARTGLKVDGIVGPDTYEKLICIIED
jgi:peptidoglycan hydrolase-like protein with peptidoglycan-binding domain